MLPHFHPDLPRASSRINDSYCITKLQRRLLAGSNTLTQTIDTLNVKLPVHHVTTVPGQSQKKDLSPGPVNCQYKECKLKSVKSVSCVTQLSCVNPVTNVPNVAPNLAVWARLQNFWSTWLDLGAGPKVVQILKEGYTLPFWTRPKLVRFPTVISCYGNPQRNGYLLEALHQLIDKNAVEVVRNQTSLSFFKIVSSPKTKQSVETDLGSEQSEFLPQGGEIQDGDPGNHQDITPASRVDHLHRLQGCILPHPNTGTVQEISEVSCSRANIPIQSPTIRTFDSTTGVHCSSKGGQTDGYTQGYKDPPVLR